MPSTLRIELAKAGFTVGAAGTTIVLQKYADPAGTQLHARPIGSMVYTPSATNDPILDWRFANGHEWNNAQRICAYDSSNIYILINLPYQGAGFRAFPLSPSNITTEVPSVSDNAFRRARRRA